jgi:hypothetical protein
LKGTEYRHRDILLAFQALDQATGNQKTLPKPLVERLIHQFRPHYCDAKIQTLMRCSLNKHHPDLYDIDEFEVLFVSVMDDIINEVRSPVVPYPFYIERLLDLLSVSEFIFVAIAIVEYWDAFYTPWFWGVMGGFRLIFTADMCWKVQLYGGVRLYGASRFHVFNLLGFGLAVASFISLLVALPKDNWVLTLADDHSPCKKAASALILLAATCDVASAVFRRIVEFAALLTVLERLIPAFIGQATVVFTLMHVFTYIGMYMFGGKIHPDQPQWHPSVLETKARAYPENMYYLLNFNTYREGMLTLFMLLVVVCMYIYIYMCVCVCVCVCRWVSLGFCLLEDVD